MEKLIPLKDMPEVELINSALVLQGEAKIYFEDSKKNKYELHFPIVYDFRQCVEAAFIGRYFEESEERAEKSIYLVEKSERIKSFISSSDGVYGDDESRYQHYIMNDSIDAIIEIIATEPPVISKIAPPQNKARIADLINSTSFSAVSEKICLHYGEKELHKYMRLYRLLENKAQEFIPSGDLTIFIKTFLETEDDSIFITEFDENDPRLHFDVCGYMGGEDIVYSIAASDYGEFLTYQIDEDTLHKFSPENILAHCLYEITAYGFEK